MRELRHILLKDKISHWIREILDDRKSAMQATTECKPSWNIILFLN